MKRRPGRAGRWRGCWIDVRGSCKVTAGPCFLTGLRRRQWIEQVLPGLPMASARCESAGRKCRSANRRERSVLPILCHRATPCVCMCAVFEAASRATEKKVQIERVATGIDLRDHLPARPGFVRGRVPHGGGGLSSAAGGHGSRPVAGNVTHAL